MDADSGHIIRLDEVVAYYDSKLGEHGLTPRGVDWNGEEGQVVRFQQLCKLLPIDNEFSVIDYGCGFGSMYDFLTQRWRNFQYVGYDISERMISAAKERHKAIDCVDYCSSIPADFQADYCVASGVLNVKQTNLVDEWEHYCKHVIHELDARSRSGFAFNCLSSYSDVSKQRKDLYYADPTEYFRYCMQSFSGQVALLHDYQLYEFTIIVRK
jgi:SAM-dependent methyltransferase